MKRALSQIESVERFSRESARGRTEGAVRRGTRYRAKTKGEGIMQSQARTGRTDAAAPHPLAELLECPPEAGNLLNGATRSVDFEAGSVVFQQSEDCRGLYVILSGRYFRKADRRESHLQLGPARAGDLVELAAVLGEPQHTYTLTAQTSGSVLLMPIEALQEAFQTYPPLRMHLLEELAREVSRAYNTCCQTRTARTRRRSSAAATA